MKSWIFLAAVSVNVIVKAIPLLLFSRPAVASLNDLSPTPPRIHAQPITPSALGAPHTFHLPATNTRSTLYPSGSRRPAMQAPPSAVSLSSLGSTHAFPVEAGGRPICLPHPLLDRGCRRSPPRRTESALLPTSGGPAAPQTTVSESSGDKRSYHHR
jgi:hypothetical protein